MRTKLALRNVISNILLQVATAISGILLPRFFIELYGSAVNGLVSSISQFIAYISLVEAGVGIAGAVALYKPLAEKDILAISKIVVAAKNFYLRSGTIFLILVSFLIVFYPYAVNSEINDIAFIRWMIVVLSLSSIIDYFFLGKYRVLLTADQHGYIISIAQIVGIVATIAISIFLMECGYSAIVVKSVTTIVYFIRSLCVWVYAKKHYSNLSFDVDPDYNALSQRWSALLHQVVGMIVNNLAVVLLTLMVTGDALSEISVYSVYSMISVALIQIMNSISSSLSSGFGEVISKKEYNVLRESFSNYEFAFFTIVFVAFSCMAVLFYPFMSIYSASFGDSANYMRIELVVLFTAAGLIQCVRLPSATLIYAAGHYSQTRWRAILEALINLVVSMILIRPLGVAGVVIAMCISYSYRTIDVIVYSSRHFINDTLKKSAKRIILNFSLFCILTIVGILFVPQTMSTWFSWFGYAFLYGTISGSVFIAFNCILEPIQAVSWINRARSVLIKNNS